MMLTIRGEVERSIDLDAAGLAALDQASTGGDEPPAVAVAAVVGAATPSPAATHATVISRDGGYRASIPLADLNASGVIEYRADGVPLPSGGSYRLKVPAGRTLCWNVKDVAEIEVTIGSRPDDVAARPKH